MHHFLAAFVLTGLTVWFLLCVFLAVRLSYHLAAMILGGLT